MPTYRVLYLRDEASIERFRSLAPPEGVTTIKAKDYDQVASLDAPHEYAAWKMLQAEESASHGVPRPMGVGDVLEMEGVSGASRPRVCRYGGFDDAAWWVFEPRSKKAETKEETAPAPEASV